VQNACKDAMAGDVNWLKPCSLTRIRKTSKS
jgi:hypothetical protein